MKKKILVCSFFLAIFLCLFLLISDKNINKNKKINTIKSEEKKNLKNNQDLKNKEDDKPVKPDNEDIVGFIKITGTGISNYIAQGTDNDYYLNHNLNKEEDIAGSVFLDYRNNLNDRKLLIFGHNARKLKTVPFHDLEKYLDESFYKENSYIDIELNGENSKWQIFSVMIVPKGNNTHMLISFNDAEWINHLNWLKNNSLYDTNISVNSTDRIVILQTCNYEPDNTYLLVCAKKI